MSRSISFVARLIRISSMILAISTVLNAPGFMHQAFATITATAHSTTTSALDDDEEDPDVWWTSGNYLIDADATVTHRSLGVFHDVRTSGSHTKSSLPTSLPGFPITKADDGPQFANARVTSGTHDVARGTGTAFLNTFLVDEYELSVEAFSRCGLTCRDAISNATITDPFVMGWTDTDVHTLVWAFNLKSGASVSEGSSVVWRSDLDFGNDGSLDQLFFRVEIGTETNYPYPVDLVLGPGVFLGGGQTEAMVEADLAALVGPDGWDLPADYPLDIRYATPGGAPGEIAITLDGAATAEAGRSTSETLSEWTPEKRAAPHGYSGPTGNFSVEVLHNDFEDGSGLPSLNGWTTHDLSGGGVGDFAQVWASLSDADPCADNGTPALAFIDDGAVEPGTGGSQCQTKCYGPSGYVVNTTSGLSDTEAHLHNVVRSPITAWPDPYLSMAALRFDVYSDEALEPGSGGTYAVWSIRSTADPAGSTGWTPWRDRDRVYYGGPGYFAIEEDVTELLTPDCAWVQVAVGVRELGYRWGYDGNDASPGPYFDNVALVAGATQGPLVAARVEEIAEDAFPASGVVDYGNLAANAVPVTIPGDTSGFALICSAQSVRTGAHLTGPPQLHYKLFPNPVFDAVRTSGWPASGSVSDPDSIEGGRWGFTMPASGFFFPGDVIHFFVEAEDDASGDVERSHAPADTTGFSSGPHVADGYPDAWRVRALPSVFSTTPGDQPPILLWYGAGEHSALTGWRTALQHLGYLSGTDYDAYYVKSAGDDDVVVAKSATVYALSDYTTILYEAGAGGAGVPPESVSQNLDTWLSSGNRRLLLTGGRLASGLAAGGPEGLNLLTNWMSVSLVNDDLSGLVGGRATVGSVPMTANGILVSATDWLFYGSCSSSARFDGVEPSSPAVRLAEFTDSQGSPGAYTLASAVHHDHAGSGSEVVFMPASLGSIWTSGTAAKADAAAAARTLLLGDVLTHFGHAGSGLPASVPGAKGFTVSSFPNPFNPMVHIRFALPRAERISIGIYDVRGQLVSQVLDEVRPAGPGSVAWRGTTDRGRAVASGVYFYRARAGGSEEIGKLTLVR